ncbi:MAG: hypothetical protein ABIS20_19570 [Thermoanaerobaculia bacterium]
MASGVDAASRTRFARFPVQILILILLLALALAPLPARGQGSCYPTATHLCLNGDRFQVDVDWMLPSGPGKGQAVPLTADTGLFWFFGNSNLELIVKVLDGRPVNGHFWVYYGGLSDVEYRITITDTRTGVREIYTNPPGRLASGSDTSAFDVEPAAAPGPVRPGGTGEAPPLLRLGEEIRVNVMTQNSQSDPAVAVSPGGATMVVWTGPPAPPDNPFENLTVYGRFYDQAGSPRGGEVRLNAATAGARSGARVAAGPGGFMAVWNDEDHVVGRLYGKDGQPLGGEIRIGATAGPQGRPAIVGDPAGGFLVGWPDAADTGSLRLQRFNLQGNVVGNEIVLLRSGSAVSLAASPVAQGGFLISWVESAGFLETNVRALRLDAAARPLGATALVANVDAARHPGFQYGAVPVFHADGGFSILWTSVSFNNQPGAHGLFARRYTASGEPAGDVIVLRREAIGDWAPAAVVLPSGATLALWSEYGRTEDLDGGTFARLYDSSWQPIGGELRVNTYTQAQQIGPAVAADASGALVAAWQSGVDYPAILAPPGLEQLGQDGSYYGIYAQRFTTASCALDPRQLCLNGRFRVEVRFVDPRSSLPGVGRAMPLTSDTGAFWFFDASNAEVMIKILDGRALNGHFWVFAGALSDVEYTITVTDTQTGKSKVYRNAPHQLASRSDTAAF